MSTKLITIADIQELKPMSINTDVTKKLDFNIIEAQEFDLRPVIGEELYLDLLNDFPALSTYGDLFNGSTYEYGGNTYQHDGLKAVLVYYTYSRYIVNAPTNQTAFGVVAKKTPDSEPVSEKTLARLVNQAVSGAKVYEARTIDFLNRNSSTYPKYKCAKDNKRRGGLKITAVR